jgi:hypothetical protein
MADPTAEALARFLINNGASIRERPLEVARTMLDWFGRPISELHVAALALDVRNMELEARNRSARTGGDCCGDG